MSSAKTKTISGIAWNFTEKLSIRLGQFVISIILARLLSPEDFGLIAIVMFFLNLSQVFIESGFSKALIQKIDRSSGDYSSVFVFNIGLSLLFYVLLFIVAPFISSFYSELQLVSLIRVLSLTLVINSMVIVQNVMLQVAVDFKKLAKINVASVLLSGAVGIVCALSGLGVWALVVQSLVRSVINYILFSCFVKWRMSLHFSIDSLKGLWRFASNLFVAGVIAEFTNNIYNLLIGKYFSVNSLGHYHRANNFTALTSDTVSQSIQQVTFPVLTQMQNDPERMIATFVRMMKMSAFVIFPVMTMLSVMAEPIVKILLNDDWLPVIPLLQWMAFTRLLYPLNALNLNILNATGRSDLFLKVDVSKLPIILIALLITLPMGVKSMVIGQVVCAPLYYAVNTFMSGRLYGYHLLRQLKDVFPYMLAAAILYFLGMFFVFYFESVYLQLIVGGGVGLMVYFFVCWIMKVEELKEVLNVIKSIFNKDM